MEHIDVGTLARTIRSHSEQLAALKEFTLIQSAILADLLELVGTKPEHQDRVRKLRETLERIGPASQ